MNDRRTQILLSIIVCTWNPRFDYLEKVLSALRYQTLPYSFWELLIIDNASDTVLSSKLDLSWHPHQRQIREEQLGLTKARLRGIQLSRGEVLVFVDDDNILHENYLEIALKISKNYQMLGAWGGQIQLEFETSPPEWTKPYWSMLALRELERDLWSNFYNNGIVPCGAGLCVRHVVAKQYAELVRQCPQRANLDRRGNSLVSGGDDDLALTACDISLGTGAFCDLRLIHLIPPARLQEDYLLRLKEEMSYSECLLKSFREQFQFKPTWKSHKLLQFLRYLLMDKISRRFEKARRRGVARYEREREKLTPQRSSRKVNYNINYTIISK
ncbi:glycosyltransferase family 2 protein [Tolypothrix sp. PCC 7910]|uniref:glycosyltransferase n=1 Tax=Tolypothrix sp. PCC 7910 TaxID=2099387 RepID=UPI0014277236|nr:glycosyltransferase [Tolypothrix sp. PCC 7910]QIR37182.1 glycosyltransferase family 2 protein [Tolypothrix sp. PCC 7910]